MDQQEWLRKLVSHNAWGDLLAPGPEARAAAGYGFTLEEILQQPWTWGETARRSMAVRQSLAPFLAGCEWVVITGSGSSQYAGECVHPALQPELGIPVVTLGGGWLLLEGSRAVPSRRPGLLVSLARSGESPESIGVVELFLESEPQVRHLIITCNESGRLATQFSADPRVTVLQLDPRTNDRSLVMTSSFTNMAIACRALGWQSYAGAWKDGVERIASAGKELLERHADTLSQVALEKYERVVYLGSRCRYGAAREAALKMLEMNSGRVATMAETYLGLRHGPMCAINEATLVVCLLDADQMVRAYEEDLIAELNRKELSARKLVIGEEISRSVLLENDVAIEIPELGDINVPVLDVLAGQLLAFFRCLAEGLRPDSPSDGVISRVVNEFTVHRNER